MQLALVEKDMSVLRFKHHALAKAEVNTVPAAKLSRYSKRLFEASSIANLQVDQLRLQFAPQDHPADAEKRLLALRQKADSYESDFRSLAANDPVEKFKEGLKKTIDEMGLLKKFFGKDKVIKAELHAVKDAVQPKLDEPADAEEPETDPASQYSILMWRDANGTGELNAWYTNDYTLAKLAEPDPPPNRRSR